MPTPSHPLAQLLLQQPHKISHWQAAVSFRGVCLAALQLLSEASLSKPIVEGAAFAAEVSHARMKLDELAEM